jgi:hypothetical protein
LNYVPLAVRSVNAVLEHNATFGAGQLRPGADILVVTTREFSNPIIGLAAVEVVDDFLHILRISFRSKACSGVSTAMLHWFIE